MHAQLERRGGLAGLSNVQVHARRVTPIDRAKANGSWKVMVRELEKRGLPATGTGGYGPPVEKEWIMGLPERQKKWRRRLA